MDPRHKRAACMATVACGIIIFLNAGTSSLMSVFLPYYVQDMPQYTITQLALNSTFGTISGFVFSLVGAKLIKALTPKWSLLVGSACTALFVFLMASAQTPWQMYIAGIIAGGSLGLGAHASCAGVLSGFYGAGMGKVIGVVFGLSTFGGAALCFLGGQLAGYIPWRTAYLAVGVGAGIIGMVLNLILIRKPETPKPASESVSNQAASPAAEEDGLTLQEAVRTPSFAFFFLAMVCGAMLYGGFMNFATTFWVQSGMDASTAAGYISVLNVFGAAISMASGFIIARFGSRILMMICFVGFVIGMVFTCMMAGKVSIPLLLLSLLFIAMVRPVNSLPALVLPELFGRKDYNAINPLGMAAYYCGTALSSVVIGMIRDMTGSFTAAFITLAVISVVAYFLFIAALKVSPYQKMKRSST